MRTSRSLVARLPTVESSFGVNLQLKQAFLCYKTDKGSALCSYFTSKHMLIVENISI